MYKHNQIKWVENYFLIKKKKKYLDSRFKVNRMK